MKIGVITDIHNNFYALQAVLQHFEKEQLDGIICCGDIVSIGVYPEETVQAVMQIPDMLACVCGNHERYHTEGYGIDAMSSGELAQHKWESRLLSKSSLDFIASLPLSQILEIMGYKIHVTHFGIKENNDYVRLPKFGEIGDMQKIFGSIDADVILHGHNHMVYDIQGKSRYINPGSLGCPAEDRDIARAGILHIDEQGISFENVRVKYDVIKTLEDMDSFDYPAKDFIKKIFYGVDA